MAFKNLRLFFMTLLMAAVFTGVIFTLFRYQLLVGVLVTFLLISVITIFLLKEMIEQKYDLLSDPPKNGQPVAPFQLIAFGKVFWQYPPEGSFIFEPSEYMNEVEILNASSSSHILNELPNRAYDGKSYEMGIDIFNRSNLGRKSDRSEEEWEALVKEYLSQGNYEKQSTFCLRNHIGSPRTFRNYIRRYKHKYGIA